MKQEHQNMFEPDQIVWAKVGGYPWWPGQVIRYVKQINKYQVYFQLSRQVSYLSQKNLLPYYLQGIPPPIAKNQMTPQWKQEKAEIDNLLRKERMSGLQYLEWCTTIKQPINWNFFKDHSPDLPFNLDFVSIKDYISTGISPQNGPIVTNQNQNEYIFKRYFPLLREACQQKNLQQFDIMKISNEMFSQISDLPNKENEAKWFIEGIKSMSRSQIFTCYIA